MEPSDDIGLLRAGFFTERALREALLEQRKTGVDPVLLDYLTSRHPRLQWLTAEEWFPVVLENLKGEPNLTVKVTVTDGGTPIEAKISFKEGGAFMAVVLIRTTPAAKIRFYFGTGKTKAVLVWDPWVMVDPQTPFGGSFQRLASTIRYGWEILDKITQGLIPEDLDLWGPNAKAGFFQLLEEMQPPKEEEPNPPWGEGSLLDRMNELMGSFVDNNLYSVNTAGSPALAPVIGSLVNTSEGIPLGVLASYVAPYNPGMVNLNQMRDLIDQNPTCTVHTLTPDGDPETVEIDGIYYQLIRQS
jgi:hypothetical protein